MAPPKRATKKHTCAITRSMEKQDRARREAEQRRASTRGPVAEVQSPISLSNAMAGGVGSSGTRLPPMELEPNSSDLMTCAAGNRLINEAEIGEKVHMLNARLCLDLSLEKERSEILSKEVKNLIVVQGRMKQKIVCFVKVQEKNRAMQLKDKSIIDELEKENRRLTVRSEIMRETALMAIKKQIKSQESTTSSYYTVKKMVDDMRDGYAAVEDLKKETELLHAKLIELQQGQEDSK